MRDHIVLFISVFAFLIACGGKSEATHTELTVYTAVEAEDLKKYAAAFEAVHPEVKIRWVRDSTGIITAKLLAEKVETYDEFEAYKKLGFRLFQGYFFARPHVLSGARVDCNPQLLLKLSGPS